MGKQNKYELTADSIRFYKNRTLCRIRALKDFSDIKAGEVGGFVETEKLLRRYQKRFKAFRQNLHM